MALSLIFACKSADKLNVNNLKGRWKVVDCNFKVPGWHTSLIGSLYEFKDSIVVITPTNLQKFDLKYSIDESNLNLIFENGGVVRYSFSFDDSGRLFLENEMLKIEFLK